MDTQRITTITPSVFTAGNRFLSVDIDAVQFPNGQAGTYARVTPASPKGAIGIVRRLVRGIPQVALVRQHRYPIDEVTLEFPRGNADTGDTFGGFVNEVVEELGLEPANVTRVGSLRPDTGLLTTQVDVFHAVAHGEIPERHVEDLTGLQAHWVPQHEFAAMVAQGEIVCGMTLAAWALLTVSSSFVMPGSVDL